jgi:signal transduction histidine kinase/ActR/RegA family two-component response regulator
VRSPADPGADARRTDLLARVAHLADAGRRAEAARSVAAFVGAEDLVIFIRDREVDALLPAPGFAQSLPEARAWRAFAGECVRRGEATARLPLPGRSEPGEVRGLAGADGSVLALLGGAPDAGRAAELARLLPLLAAAFHGELTAAAAAGQAALAKEAAEQARLLAASLDEARQVVQAALNEAKAANAAKDEFLAVLSHELRNPLSPVLLAANLLEGDARLPADMREQIRTIRRNVELEARLIDDLLDLTRITHGKLQLHRVPAGAHRLLAQTLDMYRADLHEKNLSLAVDLRAEHDGVLADPARLQQVFWNLIKNAVKFTESGGAVTVRTYNDAATPGTIRIEVADTGIGIEPARLGKIFGAFDQGDAGVTKQFGGLGLGLSISRALVEMHGGTIRAASEGAGRGATFAVELPTHAATARPAAPRAGPGAAGGGGGDPASRPMHILLVEDHADTARLMMLLLKGFGHSVRAAASIEAAKRAAAAERFDLLISDVGLPDGTGMELMRDLKGQYDIAGIALTGYGMEDDVRQCREAGFAEHFTKPIDPERLRAAIERRRREPAGGAPTSNRPDRR